MFRYFILRAEQQLTGIQLCTAERFLYAQDRECIKAEEGPVWHKY